ncbi:LysM peptidoglycan-binding domain-containing protein [Clostridium botulinum]|uniref:5'-nucleotidase C-terminal domain-containing protein n=1 Tax=unclassified Clostridium TaxID=2614128 RepID=UPI0013FB4667|nr:MULTISPECIES: 5'-nucleotidase C-terminal domain-containing protein [unclassified Clostridium]NFN93722.1 LysM peptidoglycan-binding domain-containing protein [Clostridium botulinum]NFS95484.1 LysM peptidoglycan-binding domain-containing protein [Clostridium botulinum]
MKKKILSAMLSLTLVFSLNTTSVWAASKDDSTKITIIHTNDTHSRVLSADGGFGFAKIATIANETKKENPNTLLVDAGDTLHGKPIVNVSKGENAVKILDAAGYDFMVPGNHDFNYGNERLIELSKLAKNFKMLDANVKKNGKDMLPPYEIIEKGNVKIGIFGLSTPETAYKTNPANVKDVTFEDPIKVSEEMVKELKDKTDVIVALAHVGLDDSSVVTSKQIAEKVKGIDVIIDGHSHTTLNDGLVVNNTLIAQTGEYDQNLGVVELEVKDKKVTEKKAKLLNSKDYKELKEDEKVTDLLNDIQAENDKVFSEVVASNDVLLDGVRGNVRTKETNLGNLTADATREVTKADIAFVNGGTLRTSIEPGDITKGKLAELFPFGSVAQTVKLSGSDIVNALEVSVGAYPTEQGGFLQVSGMTFLFDPMKEKGNRVFDVKVGENPIDLNKEYTVAINDFLSQGGDGYTMLKTTVVGEFATYDDIFAKYLNDNGMKNDINLGRIQVKENGKQVVTNQNNVVLVQAVPTVQEPQVSAKTETVYTVIAGDNLTKIARINNTTWQTLAEYNNLQNPDLIYVGDQIKIPA